MLKTALVILLLLCDMAIADETFMKTFMDMKAFMEKYCTTTDDWDCATLLTSERGRRLVISGSKYCIVGGLDCLVELKHKLEKLNTEHLLMSSEEEEFGRTMRGITTDITPLLIKKFISEHDLDEIEARSLMIKTDVKKLGVPCEEDDHYCYGMSLLDNKIEIEKMMIELHKLHPNEQLLEARRQAEARKRAELEAEKKAEEEARHKAELEVKRKAEAEYAAMRKAAEEAEVEARKSQLGLRKKLEEEHRAELELQARKPAESARMKKAEEGVSSKSMANETDNTMWVDIDSKISMLDSKLNETWKILRSKLPEDEFESLRKAQLRWIRDRDNCGADKVCIKSKYEQRLQFLNALK